MTHRQTIAMLIKKQETTTCKERSIRSRRKAGLIFCDLGTWDTGAEVSGRVSDTASVCAVGPGLEEVSLDINKNAQQPLYLRQVDKPRRNFVCSTDK